MICYIDRLLEFGAVIDGVCLIVSSPHCSLSSDFVYVIDENQKLFCVQGLAMYDGLKWMHEPRDILNLDVAPNGWHIDAPKYYAGMIGNIEKKLKGL